MFAVLAIKSVVPSLAVTVVAVGVGVFTFIQTVTAKAVPWISGYREAADFVAARAPKESVVLFSGYRDGSFIFNLRTHEDRRDLSVLRADKMLLKLAIRRSLGVEERAVTEAGIREMIRKYGVEFVVAQRDFWTDLKPMADLQKVLDSDQFEEVARIPAEANIPHDDTELRIYRNRQPVAKGEILLSVDLPTIGRSLTGVLRRSH